MKTKLKFLFEIYCNDYALIAKLKFNNYSAGGYVIAEIGDKFYLGKIDNPTIVKQLGYFDFVEDAIITANKDYNKNE